MTLNTPELGLPIPPRPAHTSDRLHSAQTLLWNFLLEGGPQKPMIWASFQTIKSL